MVLGELQKPVHHLVEVVHAVGDLFEELPLGGEALQFNILELDLEHFVKGRELSVATRCFVDGFALHDKLDGVELYWVCEYLVLKEVLVDLSDAH